MTGWRIVGQGNAHVLLTYRGPPLDESAWWSDIDTDTGRYLLRVLKANGRDSPRTQTAFATYLAEHVLPQSASFVPYHRRVEVSAQTLRAILQDHPGLIDATKASAILLPNLQPAPEEGQNHILLEWKPKALYKPDETILCAFCANHDFAESRIDRNFCPLSMIASERERRQRAAQHLLDADAKYLRVLCGPQDVDRASLSDAVADMMFDWPPLSIIWKELRSAQQLYFESFRHLACVMAWESLEPSGGLEQEWKRTHDEGIHKHDLYNAISTYKTLCDCSVLIKCRLDRSDNTSVVPIEVHLIDLDAKGDLKDNNVPRWRMQYVRLMNKKQKR